MILSEYNEIGKIAKFYGFQPVSTPTITKEDYEGLKQFSITPTLLEKTALVRTYFEEKSAYLPQPIMLWCERPLPGTREKRKAGKRESILASLGSSKSVCECLGIQTAMAIISACGYKNLEVRVNSIGDKDSTADFERKLNVHIKKNFNSFPADLRQALKKDVFAIFGGDDSAWEPFRKDCPKSLDFLGEVSRVHFKEVLEFLEIMTIPYTIDGNLVGDPDVDTETIFTINAENEKEPLAYGSRFNKLAKKIGQKRDLPAVYINLSFRTKKVLKKVKPKKYLPQFYLIQFGPEAKLKSFLIMHELHKAGVRVSHSIAKDKLAGQMSVAENSNIPYILLLGQKEALENSVVVRNTITRAQETIPIINLAGYIKKL